MSRLNALSTLAPAGLLLLASATGCESKQGLEAPLAAQAPQDILQHLRYLAASKDYKHIILMAPASAEVVFPSAWWFHNQASHLGLQLTPQELQDLNVTDMKDRLDNLPRYPVPGYDIQDARRAYNAGLYRLVKGFSLGDWNKMYVMSVQGSAADPRLTIVTLGFDSQPKLAVSCVKTAEGTYGIANLEYKVGLAKN